MLMDFTGRMPSANLFHSRYCYIILAFRLPFILLSALRLCLPVLSMVWLAGLYRTLVCSSRFGGYSVGAPIGYRISIYRLRASVLMRIALKPDNVLFADMIVNTCPQSFLSALNLCFSLRSSFTFIKMRNHANVCCLWRRIAFDI